jgi:regulator of RNase E activity RraA
MGLAWNSGLRALVTDTHVRDCDGLEPFNIAFFAEGLNPDEASKSGLGKIGPSIASGCYIVESGDSNNGHVVNITLVKWADIDVVLADLADVSEKAKGAENIIAEGQKFMGITDGALASVSAKYVK